MSGDPIPEVTFEAGSGRRIRDCELCGSKMYLDPSDESTTACHGYIRCKDNQIKRYRAEVARMRPVVEAAVEHRQARLRASAHSTGSPARKSRERLWSAVDAYREASND